MADVVLVKPPLSEEAIYGELTGIGSYEAPLGLAYLAASLIKNSITVEIVDGNIAKVSLQQLVGVDCQGSLLGASPDLVEPRDKGGQQPHKDAGWMSRYLHSCHAQLPWS